MSDAVASPPRPKAVAPAAPAPVTPAGEEGAASAPIALSVVIPARDTASTLRACLDAVIAQATSDVEVIVVDDGSRDDTAGVAERPPVRVVRLERSVGPGGARNRGVAVARAPIVLFLDADVVAAPGTLARVRAVFQDPEIDAVFGSYDDDPAAPTTVSRFKNLSHHHFHQRARRDSGTFWAGCGAVRRACLEAVGGFEERTFPLASIEDVELGQRMAMNGARIAADPTLQVKHLKRWTLRSLLAADFFRRAIPWTVIILERRAWPADLNLAGDQLASAAVALGLLLATPFVLRPWGGLLWLGLLATAIWINRDLFRLFARRGGARLAVAGFVLQQFYYVYASVGFAAGAALYAWRHGWRRPFGRRRASRPAAAGAEGRLPIEPPPPGGAGPRPSPRAATEKR